MVNQNVFSKFVSVFLKYIRYDTMVTDKLVRDVLSFLRHSIASVCFFFVLGLSCIPFPCTVFLPVAKLNPSEDID